MKFIKNNYYQEKLVKLQLSKETVKEIEFEECEFKDCSFVDCKFINCKFINCKFNNSILSAIDPTNCRFVDIIFTNCKVIGFDWTKASNVQELSFDKCQINYSNFRLLKLPKIKLINSEAKEVDFTEADLTEGVFTGTDFERSIFSKTILVKADFREAKNYYIDIRSNVIKRAHFSMPEALSLLNSLDIIID